jgi:hypothetical protein
MHGGLMASETDICNLALDRVGHSSITSLTQGTKAADLCNRNYAQARNSLLRAHPWNFAIKRVTLAQSSTTPNHEFDYYHVLPADYLKVIRTNWEADGTTSTAVYGFPGMNGYAGESTPYRIENVTDVGKCIATNEVTVKIEYTAKITDPEQFDPLFIDCLTLSIAMRVCMPLTDDASLLKAITDEFRSTMPSAQTTDAQEGTPREVVDTSPWIAARA